MDKTKTQKTIIDTLTRARHVLITAHKSPDGDSLGSQLGLAGFLASRRIPYMIVNEGVIPGKYRFLPGVADIRNVSAIDDAPEFDVAVVIECSNFERIGEVSRLVGKNCAVINIDHHQDNVPFGSVNWKDISASAAGEMVYDLIREAGVNVTPEMATNLYTAILTDTGRFHYSSTTPHSLRVAGDLLEWGADPVTITENVYFNLPIETVRLTGKALAGLEYLCDDRLCLMTIDRATFRETMAGNGDTEGLVNYSLYAEKVEIGILFTEVEENVTKVSLRSKGDLNVAEIAARYDGGGHVNASGCVLAKPLRDAKDEIVAYVKDTVYG